jgi:hypothetical protein
MNEFSQIPPIDRKAYRFRATHAKHPAMRCVMASFWLKPETLKRIENYARRQRIPRSHALERMLEIEALHHVEPPVQIDWKRKIKMDTGQYFLSFDPSKLKRKRRKKTP